MNSPSPRPPARPIGQTPELGLANQFASLHDGWIRISPYGDFPKERAALQPDGSIRYERYLQRVDRSAAETMVRQFNTLLGSEALGQFKRFVVGTPIYKGHPDLPEAARPSPDPTRYGLVSGLEARPDGLYGRIVLAEDAPIMIARDGLKWLSPYWLVRLTGQIIDGAPVCSPVKLLSAGLTRSPNIQGGQPLANERQPAPMEKYILISLLGLANDASEEQIQSALTDLKAKAARIPALESQAAQLAAQLARLENENSANLNRLQRERQTCINLLLDSSIHSGRITAGERAAWEKALSNEDDFETKAGEISRLVPKIKTVSLTGNLGQRHAALENESDRRAFLLALVSEKQSKGLSYDEAFAAVHRENPDLFQRMKKPNG